MKQFKKYLQFCKKNNLKPSFYESLKKYYENLKTL